MSLGGNIITDAVKVADGIPGMMNGNVIAQPTPVDASVGGKGGIGNTMMPVQQPSYIAPNVFYAGAAPAQVGNFDNSGRIIDPTLLAQQAMLNRAPVSYQPIISPDNYQNFYQAPAAAGGKGGNNLVVPDYRPQATLFRQDFANAAAASGGGGDSGSASANGWAGYGPSDTSYTGYSDALSSGYNANGQYSVAPVESRGTDTGFGGYGGIDGTGASMSAADADVAFGADNYGGGGGYGTDGGVSGVGVGSSDGVNGMDAASDAASAAASGGDGGGGGGGGGCVIATHAVAHGSFTPREKKKAVVWCTRTLHHKWWGESIRRGYRFYGNRAIKAGKAHEYYEEFRDFIRFATGSKRNLQTAKTFAWRSVQFFVTGLFIKG